MSSLDFTSWSLTRRQGHPARPEIRVRPHTETCERVAPADGQNHFA